MQQQWQIQYNTLPVTLSKPDHDREKQQNTQSNHGGA